MAKSKTNKPVDKDKQNKPVLTLLIVALALTVIGMLVSLDKLTGWEFFLTGAATNTSTGTSNLTITTLTSISNQYSTINFGSGYVSPSCTNCTMDSNGTFSSACCIGGFASLTSGFLLENTGNLNLSVNYSCSGGCNATGFIGGTSPLFQLITSSNNIAAQSGETGAADSSASCGGTLNITTYTNITANGDWLCGNATTLYWLDYTDSKDAFVVDIKLLIPSDATGGRGQQNATFTFTGQSSG
ncbi:MAG TPA: hypothetical protein VJG49_04465 [Candidatus Nanoarchaeia archaeon]|nr:hypothetical protein [Candidatus Nanoarchaeia archaeon]